MEREREGEIFGNLLEREPRAKAVQQRRQQSSIPRYYIPLSCSGASHFRRSFAFREASGGRAREREGERRGGNKKKQDSPINLADATPPWMRRFLSRSSLESARSIYRAANIPSRFRRGKPAASFFSYDINKSTRRCS